MNREIKALDSIMTMVCKYYSLDKKMVLSKSRDRQLVEARQMFCWMARNYTRSTFKLVGTYLDRLHSTVLLSVRKVDIQIDFDHNVKYDRDTIIDMNPQIKDINSLIYNIDAICKEELSIYNTNGFSKIDTLTGVKYRALVKALGEPTLNYHDSGDKSTCEWIVRFGDRLFTIYDWKTYDREYTINELSTWSIGGLSSLVDFKDSLINLIESSLVSINK
jgi:hypothetical protein